MGKKFKVVCERYITDIRGHEVCPGNVVAISRSGDSSKTLEVGVVTRVTKGAISIAAENWEYNYKTHKGGAKFKPAGSRSILDKGIDIQQHLVVIDNPLYSINNPQMKQVIEFADRLKDMGVFPADYKLGHTIVEAKEVD